MIKGKALMVGIQQGSAWTTIAMATSCSLEVSTSLSDATTKDDNDLVVKQEINSKNWTLKSENLVPADQSGLTGASQNILLSFLQVGTTVKVRFELFANSIGNETGDGHDWHSESGQDATVVMSGSAIVESLEMSAQNKENATISVTFKGKGAPTIGA